MFFILLKYYISYYGCWCCLRISILVYTTWKGIHAVNIFFIIDRTLIHYYYYKKIIRKFCYARNNFAVCIKNVRNTYYYSDVYNICM